MNIYNLTKVLIEMASNLRSFWFLDWFRDITFWPYIKQKSCPRSGSTLVATGRELRFEIIEYIVLYLIKIWLV